MGWSPDVVQVFWGGLQIFSGPLPRNFKHIIGFFSSNPVDCHPFLSEIEKKEGSMDMFKRGTRAG